MIVLRLQMMIFLETSRELKKRSKREVGVDLLCFQNGYLIKRLSLRDTGRWSDLEVSMTAEEIQARGEGL